MVYAIEFEARRNTVAHLLAYVTGLVNQELLLKNEYLLAESLILKAHLQPSFRLSRSERTTLAEIGKRLGRKGTGQRRTPGRPPVSAEIENVVVRLARENGGWATTGSWKRWPTWGTR